MGGEPFRILRLLATVLLAGCAAPERPLSELAPELSRTTPTELRQTPFFPQREYQCGPAALATVLVASGVDTTADALVPQVYLPGRQGSLQAEMTAATRRNGRLAYRVAPDMAALLAEVRAGHPAVVLLNLGLDLVPVWHYAVVIGYDTDVDTIILRSGTQRRREMAAGSFMRSWRKGDSWALLALAPGEMPASDEPQPYLDAAAGLERLGDFTGARASYAAALQRWPGNATALFGLANSEYALGHHDAARTEYRRLLARVPDHVAGWNNLANLLLEQGCPDAAGESIGRALVLAGADSPHRDALESTRRDIAAAETSGRVEPATCAGAL